MQLPHHRSGQQEFPRKEVHLDLAPLPPSVVDDTVDACWRRLGRPRWIDFGSTVTFGRIAEFGVGDFVDDQKCLLEEASGVLVQNEGILRDQRRSAAVEDGCARGGRLDIQSTSLRLRDCELIRAPGIRAIFQGSLMESGRSLPTEFDRIHDQSSPDTRSAMVSSETPASRSTRSRETFSPTD